MDGHQLFEDNCISRKCSILRKNDILFSVHINVIRSVCYISDTTDNFSDRMNRETDTICFIIFVLLNSISKFLIHVEVWHSQLIHIFLFVCLFVVVFWLLFCHLYRMDKSKYTHTYTRVHAYFNIHLQLDYLDLKRQQHRKTNK